MAEAITFQPDEDASWALTILTADGTAVATVLRTALIQAAHRRAMAAIRTAAEDLPVHDPDRAEAIKVLRDLETLHAMVRSSG